jgi:hypothetical protein
MHLFYTAAVHHFQTILRAKLHTLSTMDTDVNIATAIMVNSVNRTGINTISALNAQTFFHDNSTSGPVCVGTGRADFSAGRRIAGQTSVGDKAGRESS